MPPSEGSEGPAAVDASAASVPEASGGDAGGSVAGPAVGDGAGSGGAPPPAAIDDDAQGQGGKDAAAAEKGTAAGEAGADGEAGGGASRRRRRRVKKADTRKKSKHKKQRRTLFTNRDVAAAGPLGPDTRYDPLRLSLAVRRRGPRPAARLSFTRDELASDPYRIDDAALALHASFGYGAQLANNVHVSDAATMAYVSGRFVHLTDVETGSQSHIRSLDLDGIGAIAVHPERSFIAVAEKGFYPCIYIYDLPGLTLRRVLRRGTERAYSSIAFSHTGNLLASVGAAPDYMLTVWNWEREAVTLRAKAFSQEVYNVAFSPENEGALITSGTGHIRFWKMAKTFTGLKLQGEIGKFGTVEIADILGFAELPDGKVLSGTEGGDLLLWEGNLIKAQFRRPGGERCHDGPIEYVSHDGTDIITAGHDGFIRVWPFDLINNAESTPEEPHVVLAPSDVTHVGDDVKIKSVSRDGAKRWLVQDASGAVWRLEAPTFAGSRVLTAHAGPIHAVDASPTQNLAVTAGDDGAVVFWDYAARAKVASRCWPGDRATAVAFLPQALDPGGTTVIVGFASGTVRLLRPSALGGDGGGGNGGGEAVEGDAAAAMADTPGVLILHASKPHTSPITALAFSPSNSLLATGAQDSTVFFLDATQRLLPVCCAAVPAPVTALAWRHDPDGANSSLPGTTQFCVFSFFFFFFHFFFSRFFFSRFYIYIFLL
jgi:WD40 repeat protein